MYIVMNIKYLILIINNFTMKNNREVSEQIICTREAVSRLVCSEETASRLGCALGGSEQIRVLWEAASRLRCSGRQRADQGALGGSEQTRKSGRKQFRRSALGGIGSVPASAPSPAAWEAMTAGSDSFFFADAMKHPQLPMLESSQVLLMYL